MYCSGLLHFSGVEAGQYTIMTGGCGILQPGSNFYLENYKCVQIQNHKDFNITLPILRFLNTLLPDGEIPYDGVPVEEIETVAVPLTVIYSFLSIAGIIFAIVCLIFNFVLRNKKYVKTFFLVD